MKEKPEYASTENWKAGIYDNTHFLNETGRVKKKCGFIIKQSKWPPPIRTIVSDVSSFPSSHELPRRSPPLTASPSFTTLAISSSFEIERRFHFDTQHLPTILVKALTSLVNAECSP
ncbi:hypothetical protein V8C34DRAFT_57786 [Trichoderma compactum]